MPISGDKSLSSAPLLSLYLAYWVCKKDIPSPPPASGGITRTKYQGGRKKEEPSGNSNHDPRKQQPICEIPWKVYKSLSPAPW
jgi:hypothetical protein